MRRRRLEKGERVSSLEQAREILRKRRRLPDGERRRQATQATLDRFRNTSFDWREGRHCMKLAHYHVRQMGERPAALPVIKSPLAAKKELKARKADSVSALLDTMFKRIPPAMMLLGDIATVEGDQGLDAVFICAGPRRLFGWREDQPVAVVLEVSLDEVQAAWRVR